MSAVNIPETIPCPICARGRKKADMSVERVDVGGGAIICLYVRCEECDAYLNEGGVDLDGDPNVAAAQAMDSLRGAWKNAKRWGFTEKEIVYDGTSEKPDSQKQGFGFRPMAGAERVDKRKAQGAVRSHTGPQRGTHSDLPRTSKGGTPHDLGGRVQSGEEVHQREAPTQGTLALGGGSAPRHGR